MKKMMAMFVLGLMVQVFTACMDIEMSTVEREICTSECAGYVDEVWQACVDAACGSAGGGSIGGGTGGGGPASPDPGQCTFIFGYQACVVPNGSVPATWGSREQWWCCTWTGCRTEWGVCVPNA